MKTQCNKSRRKFKSQVNRDGKRLLLDGGGI